MFFLNFKHQERGEQYLVIINPYFTVHQTPSSSTASTSYKQLGQMTDTGSKTPSKTEPKLASDVSSLVIKVGSPRKPGDSFVQSEEDVMSLHIWDFAGHELYYTTHQVLSLQMYP